MFTDTISVHNILFTDTVSVHNILFTDRVSVHNILFTDSMITINYSTTRGIFISESADPWALILAPVEGWGPCILKYQNSFLWVMPLVRE